MSANELTTNKRKGENKIMYQEIIISSGIAVLKNEGKKLRKRDADSVGADDAGGRSLEAIAAGLETVDFSNITSAKSLRNIGIAMVAAGEKLQEEAAKVEKGQ